MDSIIRHFYERYKRENSFKLFHGIRETYVGISKDVIQSWINSNEDHSIRNPIFSNREELKLIIVTKPMECIQIDLVKMESVPQGGRKCASARASLAGSSRPLL